MSRPSNQGRPRATHDLCWVVLAVMLLRSVGCAGTEFVSLRKVPRNPLAGPLQLLSDSGPKATPRTDQLLRRYDLEQENEDAALVGLRAEIEADPQPKKLYAYAELAYIQAQKARVLDRQSESLELFGAAAAYAYWYLFDPRYDHFRNPYDPQFRGVCDLYNGALEGAMRIVNGRGQLRPGKVYTIETDLMQFEVAVVAEGAWHDDDFERLEFVSDYEIRGLENRHHTYGLGVPLIVVRKSHADAEPAEEFYPPGLSYAATAFLRVLPEHSADPAAAGKMHCRLELHDPVVSKDIQVAGRRVPLETDLSTPLAFFLENLESQRAKSLATLALRLPDRADELRGLYMLEPYDPQKIPVLLVHGLWSTPITWMEMFNDLRSFSEVRDQYQFWFYLYPTGQPYWVSAADLRDDLKQCFATVDPERRSAALNQMVLIGHSMGGLVSRMQTLESGDEFWRTLSDRSFEELKADPDARDKLARTVFFTPNPAIRRVVTIGTPHRGSHFANGYTRWLGRKFINLPEMMVRLSQKLVGENPGFFRDTELLSTNTSIDSLAPDSPILGVVLRSKRAPWTQYHNIVGVVPNEGLVNRITGEGDGVVSYASAHLDDVASEVTIPADHVNVHRHPKSILEVRRILREHRESAIAEMIRDRSTVPAGYYTSPTR
jgi:pimeloyl-ACP methyl ester carboxylesterase